MVVLGHSHAPLVEDDGRILLLNPGSANDRRAQPVCTMALLDVVDGDVAATLLEPAEHDPVAWRVRRRRTSTRCGRTRLLKRFQVRLEQPPPTCARPGSSAARRAERAPPRRGSGAAPGIPQARPEAPRADHLITPAPPNDPHRRSLRCASPPTAPSPPPRPWSSPPAASRWAATLPKNSVGSPQIKPSAVRSADIKNGGVRLVDLAPDARIAGPRGPAGPKGDTGASPFSAIGQARASFGNCGQSGWCYLSDAGNGTLVGRLSSAPPNSGQSWNSTGVLTLPAATPVLVRSTIAVFSFGSGGNKDSICTLKDGASSIASSGWVRMDGNTSQILTIERLVTLDAGQHDFTLTCRGTAAQSHAATDASITFIAQG